ncbi:MULTISPECIES: hypothetical protein [Nostocales]|uniref:Uncharacterized protein n=3 Tax=Nostocales TaxID=1161 RepID=A0A8S9THI5_9CYAN|nr:hypothetical protein [Tolypothrix bouteillei]KAF3891217.1 hypothetical protein DA73_0400030545 [Tolypothrix bouteillei VB521301]
MSVGRSRKLGAISWVRLGFASALISAIVLSLSVGLQPVSAQRVNAGDAWRLVYQQLPDFPRENQYTSKETGKKAENNTLVSRLIAYHLYVKTRAPNFRLDWKLTLADYLGANEVMYEGAYPGTDTLRQNPLDGDKAAIARLNRRQRDALIQALVNVFSPNSQSPPTATPDNSSQPGESAPTRSRSPQPGDAQLLK